MGMAASPTDPAVPVQGAPPDALDVKREPVHLALLVQRSTTEAFSGLQEMCRTLPGRGEKEGKLALLKYLVKTRQRLLRLHAITEWAKQGPLISRGQQLSGTLEWHDNSCRDAADQLYFLHAQLNQARAPVYDVATALEVLTTGSYSRLPAVIQDLRPPPPLPPSEQASALLRADRTIRARLLECELPPQLTKIEVQNGAVRMRVKDEFEVRLTLGYEGDLSKWRVLWLSLGAIGSESADRGGKVGGSGLRGLTEAQRAALGREVERRMGLAPDPVREMYRVLHELSANLVLDSVFRQAHALKQGTWKDVIRLHFGKGETGSVFTSLKIEYWDRQAPRSANRLQSGSVSVDPFRPSPSSRLTPQPDQVLSAGGLPGRENWALKGPPSLKIELDEDRHVSCSHWPVVVDPETEESALFSVGDCGADLERLLEKAVTCSVHSRLLELEEAIGAEALLSCGRSTGEWDEAFGSEAGGSTEGRKEGGVEKLWVRVYDNVGVGVEVNRRTGHFVLRQPVGLLSDVRLRQLEERLNSGSEAAALLFLELRKAALQRMFQSIASEMGLEVYAHGCASLDLPLENGPTLPTDALVCAFPGVFEGSSFFLALSFDMSCIPRFALLASDRKEVKGAVNEGVSASLSGPVDGSGALEATANEEVREPVSRPVNGAVRNSVSSLFKARPNVTRWMTVEVGDVVIGDSDPAASLLGWGSETERAAAIVEEERTTQNRREAMAGEGENRVKPGSVGAGFGNLWRGRSTASRGALKGKESSASGDPLALLKEWPDTDEMDADWTNGPTGFGGLGDTSAAGGSEPPPLKGGVPLKAGAVGVKHEPIVNGPGEKRTLDKRFERSVTMDMVEGLLEMLEDPPGDPFEATKAEVGDRGLEVWDVTTRGGEMGPPKGLVQKTGEEVGPGAAGGIGRKRQRESGTEEVENGLLDFETGGRPADSDMLQGADNIESDEPAAKKQRIESDGDQVVGLDDGQSLTLGTGPSNGGSGLGLKGGVLQGIGSGNQMESAHEAQDQEMGEARMPDGESDRLEGASGTLTDLVPNSTPEATQPASILETEAEQVEPTQEKTANPETLEPAQINTSEERCRLAVGRRFSSLLAAANEGKAPLGIYRAAFYRALEHCRLCIKHDVIIRQLTSAGIAHTEEVGLRRPSTDLKIKVPGLEGGDDVAPPWPPARVLLGGPGVPGVTVLLKDTYFKSLAGLASKSGAGTTNSALENASTEGGPQGVERTTDRKANSFAKEEASKAWLSSEDVHLLPSPSEDSHMQCTQAGLQIRVKRITPAFASELAEDLKRVWLARAFVLHLAEALGVLPGGDAGSDELERLAKKEAPWSKFTITGVGLMDVELSFEGFRTVLVSVTWPRGFQGAKVALLPQGLERLEKHLEEFVDEGEVALLLDAVRIAAVPQGLLAESLPSARLMKRVMYSPTEVQLQLWSPYRARFTFRNCFTLEMRCFDGAHVWLQPVPPADPSSSKGFAQIPGFQWCVNEEIAAARTLVEGGVTSGQGESAETQGFEEGLATPRGKLARFRSFRRLSSGFGVLQGFPSFGRQGSSGKGDSDSLVSPGSGSSGALKLAPPGSTFPGGRPRLTDTGAYAGMWVPWWAITKVCKGLWPDLAVHWAVVVFVECVHETKELFTRDNEWQILKHDAGRPLLQLRCGTLAVQLSASSHALKFKLLPGTTQDVSVTKADVADLEEYFYTRVLRSPQHRDRVASFVSLLALPVKTLRDFVGLIRWEKIGVLAEKERSGKGEGGTHLFGEICQEKKPLPPGVSEYMEPFAQGRDSVGEEARVPPRRVEGNVYYNRRKGTVDFALGFKCPVGDNRAPWQRIEPPGDVDDSGVLAPGSERFFLLTWLRCSVQDESIQLWDVQGPLGVATKERLSMLIKTALELNTRGESEESRMQRAAAAIQATLASQ